MGFKLRAALSAAIGLVAACATSNDPDASPRLERLAAVDAIIAPEVDADAFAGVVLITRRGETLHHAAYGIASRELDVAHSVDSVFLTGSITKLATMMTVLKLVEDGDLALDQTMDEVFPGVALRDAGEITVEHLLAHTAGLPGIRSDAMELKTFELQVGDAFHPNDFLAYVFDQPRENAPGERGVYGNLNYDVLQLAVERAAGRPFAEELDTRVLKPLAMARAGMNDRATLIANRVPGYDPLAGGPANARQSDGGSMYATAADLGRLLPALFEDDFLPGVTVDQLRSYGLSKREIELDDGRGVEVLVFNGVDMGYSAEVAYFPGSGVGLALASNIGWKQFHDLRQEIAAIVLAD